MSRPQKKGLDFFMLDCAMDSKVKLIQAKYGLQGFAIVIKLFQKIYGEHGYYCEWNEDEMYLFMVDNGIHSDDESLVVDVVTMCLEKGVFKKTLYENYGILTSKGIQKRFLIAISRRKDVVMEDAFILCDKALIPDNVCINNTLSGVIVDINSNSSEINDYKSTQSKVKESKVKESKKNITYSSAEASSAIINMPLKDGTEYPIYQKDIDGWKEAYPHIDVEQQLRRMRQWCLDNPKNRKTEKGVRRFVGNWLGREHKKRRSGVEDFLYG